MMSLSRRFRHLLARKNSARAARRKPRRSPQALTLEQLEVRLAPAVGFDGINSTQTGLIPPDTQGAVGPNHFVESVNGRFAIYSRVWQQGAWGRK